MNLNRRDFLKGTVGLSAVAVVDPDFELRMRGGFRPFSIVQGPTNETSTQIAVDLPKGSRVRYLLFKDQVSGQPFQEVKPYASFERIFHPDRIDHIRFEQLEVGVTYVLQIISDFGAFVLDERSFQALDTLKPNARVALLSCMSDMFGGNISAMWQTVEKSAPDQILLMGDNVYGDIAGIFNGPIILWRRYMDTRRTLDFYHWYKLVPSIAIWDDHDFGKNNVGYYEHRENSLSTFNAFYAQEAIAGFFEKNEGVSSSFELFGHRFILLDGRYYRLPEDQVILGEAQMTWFENKIRTSGKPLFVGLGSQVFGGYKSGNFSLEGAAAPEFARMVTALKQADQPSLFGSGDVHFTELMNIQRNEYGFEGYEITSSCLHSLALKALEENPRRIQATLKNNFVLLELSSDGGGHTTCYGEDAIRFESEIHF